MSFLDLFRSRDYESYLFKENVKLEDQIKALKKENKALLNQLHGISRWNPYSCTEDEVFNTILFEERKKKELIECNLNDAREENRELKKRLNEKDDREHITKIQTLEYELRGMKDNHEKLKTELKIYKDFVIDIMGVLNENKED